MKSICPECKNELNTSKYKSIKENMIIECHYCGITLLVKKVDNGIISTEIVDEGK